VHHLPVAKGAAAGSDGNNHHMYVLKRTAVVL
jgi:hypothetical protein